MNPNPTIANQPVYQADNAMLQSVHHCREKVHEACKHHMHKHVRIHTVTGEMHEGVLVGFDHQFVYIDISHSAANTRFFPGPVAPFNPYYTSPILPLVLFNLLAISLI